MKEKKSNNTLRVPFSVKLNKAILLVLFLSLFSTRIHSQNCTEKLDYIVYNYCKLDSLSEISGISVQNLLGIKTGTLSCSDGAYDILSQIADNLDNKKKTKNSIKKKGQRLSFSANEHYETLTKNEFLLTSSLFLRHQMALLIIS